VSEAAPIVYLNGRFLPLEEARVPVMDRGFLFGDGVYEMLPVYGKTVLREDEHLARLAGSLNAVDIPNPHDESGWKSLIRDLLDRNDVSDHRSVYIEVTRGVGDRDHLYDSALLTPTVFMLCRPVKARDYSGGVGAITHADIRWDYCHIKALSLLPAVLLKQRASRAGCHEAILLRSGEVTEGASSNVFVVRDGVITTPPKSNDLLPGNTRDLIVELAHRAGMPCREEALPEQVLRDADEIWITSSTMEIAPVVKLDGRNVGTGETGPLWKRMKTLYEEFKQNSAVGNLN